MLDSSRPERTDRDEPTGTVLLRFVAEFAGYQDLRWQLGKLTGHLNNAKRETEVPDYLNSVDAICRDVIPKLNRSLLCRWDTALAIIIGSEWIADRVNAPARTRCLALYRAINGKLPECRKK